MSDKVLKIVPAPEAKKTALESQQAEAQAPAANGGRKRLRMILLVVLPLLALLGGGYFYLSGGRYIDTDNAYVGAQKVLITPDVSGKIVNVAVHEGQHVNPGDELLLLDATDFV